MAEKATQFGFLGDHKMRKFLRTSFTSALPIHSITGKVSIRITRHKELSGL